MLREVDLAIIGNGAIGSALALRFSELHRTARIAVVGPSHRPGSASLAAAAMLNVFAELDAVETPLGRAKLAMGIDAARAWPRHLDLLNRRLEGLSVPPVRLLRGTVVLHDGHPGGGPTFDAIVEALKQHREPFAEIDPTTLELIQLLGTPQLPRAARAIRIENEGMVSSRQLHRAYDDAFARAPNVDVVDAEVERISIDKGAKILTTPSTSIRARTVVIAAGARTQELIDQLDLGSRIPRLAFGIGVALVLRVPCRSSDVVRCIGQRGAGGPYLVPYGNDHLYVGATSHLAEKGTLEPPDGAIRSLLDAAADHVHPCLRDALIVRTLVGWRPTTLDTYPLLGRTSMDGVWIASGTKRDGFHLSPRIAEELAECLTTDRQPFDGRFVPERPLLLDVPRAVAIERTVGDIVERRGKASSLDDVRREILSVYERLGLADHASGIPAELFEMYRLGSATANLSHYRMGRSRDQPDSGRAKRTGT